MLTGGFKISRQPLRSIKCEEFGPESSVIKCFFLKNTIAEPKKHEKHEQKSPKTREKHEFLAKISKNLTPLTFFIAFLCINIFQNSKIGNIF